MERSVYHLARHLQGIGVETVLLTRPPTRGGTFPGDVVTVPYGGNPASHGRVLQRTLHYPPFSARLGEAVAAMVRSGRADVVHAQGLTALGYGRLRVGASDLTAPLVMNPQGMEEHKTVGLKRLALGRLRALSREAARLSDRVIATDEATRKEVPGLLGVDGARVVVLPNGVDPEEILESTPDDPEGVAAGMVPALAGASLVFLSVGRIEAYKGFDDTRRAFALLGPRLPRDWAWVVVGDGPERARLARSASPHEHFIGRVDEGVLHALYERADVFVHATRYEGSSLVTLEAMAHRLPVVATKAGGIPDKVSEETGRLVDPGDVVALAEALDSVAADAGSRRRLGERGRARALTLFAWPQLARRTVALYEELLRERRG
jgi:glycosyltransferase involved in cell wall biosynthesis